MCKDKISSDDLLVKALSDAGLSIEYVDGKIILEPVFLKLNHLEINTSRRGMYKTLVPTEPKEDNIFYINEPPVYYATTENGKQIPVYIEQGVTHNHKEVHPDD